MLRSVASRVAWVGRTASMVFGLALVMALVLGVASLAFGANGQNFILGQLNKATAVTQLNGNVSGGPALRVNNSKTDGGSRALQLGVAKNKPPLVVNATAGKAKNLNADKLDGKDYSEIGVTGLQEIRGHTIFNSVSPKSASVACPPGKQVVGTGFDFSGGTIGTFPNRLINVGIHRIEAINNEVILEAYEIEPTSNGWMVFVSAICAKEGTP